MLKSFRQRVRGWFLLSPREFRVVLMVSFLFLVGALAYIWPNVRMVQLAYEFQSQKRLNQNLIREHDLLLLEKVSLTSLERVRTLSRDQLSMQSPDPDQVVTVFLK